MKSADQPYDIDEIAPGRFMVRDPRANTLLKREGDLEGRLFTLRSWRREGLLARLRERGFRVRTLRIVFVRCLRCRHGSRREALPGIRCPMASDGASLILSAWTGLLRRSKRATASMDASCARDRSSGGGGGVACRAMRWLPQARRCARSMRLKRCFAGMRRQ